MPIALFCVSKPSGLCDFARGLYVLGWTLLASGETTKALQETGLRVQDIGELTSPFDIPDEQNGLLHPLVLNGVLHQGHSEPSQADKPGQLLINMVVIDMPTLSTETVISEEYPPKQDIAKTTLLRAAAGNYQRVAVVISKDDYPILLAELRESVSLSMETHRRLAEKAFAQLAIYDTAVANFLGGHPLIAKRLTPEMPTMPSEEGDVEGKKKPLVFTLYPIQTLRYGENPHQGATLYAFTPQEGPLGGEHLCGESLSYSNLFNLNLAWRTARSFQRDTVVIVKHGSLCGVASANTLEQAFPLALASDPLTAFGGVIGTNKPFDRAIARSLGKLFIEGIIAPGFTPKAVEMLIKRKDLHLISMENVTLAPRFEMRSINHGVLIQDIDLGDPPVQVTSDVRWQNVTQRQPTPDEWQALEFAWKVAQYAPSNAAILAKIVGDVETTVGIGSGHPNRLECIRLAAQRAGKGAHGAVMAVDAFLPFADAVEEAAKVGISAIVQSGGSPRDQECIEAANRHNIAMVFTGIRHLRY